MINKDLVGWILSVQARVANREILVRPTFTHTATITAATCA